MSCLDRTESMGSTKTKYFNDLGLMPISDGRSLRGETLSPDLHYWSGGTSTKQIEHYCDNFGSTTGQVFASPVYNTPQSQISTRDQRRFKNMSYKEQVDFRRASNGRTKFRFL